jgi:hypothetical protein
MTEICKDTTESINTASLISTDNFAYSPTIQLYQLDRLQLEFEKNIVYVPQSNEFIDLYGQELFNTALISFNNFLAAANRNPNLNLAVDYPYVQERLNKGVAITSIEFSVFMSDSGLNPYTTQSLQVTNPKTVLALYESSINGSFTQSTMGTFCELAPSIFGAVSDFFDKIQNFANKITDIIGKIQNFSLASLLDSLKTKILKVVEDSINKIKKIVENFSMDGLISDANKFFHSKVLGKFYTLKADAMKFFDKLNVENFKKKIEGLLSYAANIFKDPKIEEIQFLIYRFCSFISNVENIINGVKAPLEDFSNRYVYAGNILKTNSSINTIAAVSAGAKRPVEDDVKAAIERGISAEKIRGNQQPPSADEYKDLPQWNEGKGDSRVKFEGNWVKPRSQGGMGEDGWNMPGNSNANIDSKVYLMRVYKEFSRKTGVNQIIINSAYRDPIYNANIRPPGARNSKHMLGIAFDIKWNGYPNNREVFIEIARSFGFKGIGIYRTFVHIDRRAAPYTWNG